MHLNNQPAFIIADHRTNLRYALYKLLAATYPQCTIKQASDAEKLLHAAAVNLYDVIFIDHCLPPHGGFKAFTQLIEQHAGCTVILFGADADKPKVTDALMSGAAAFFSWHDEPAQIKHAVQEVLQRGVFITHEQMQMIRSMQQHRRYQSKLPQLTKREKEELALLAKGYTSKQIADTLFIGKRTAENYRNSLLQKTGTGNTIALINYAKKAGWLNEEEGRSF